MTSKNTKKYIIPDGFLDILSDLAKEILRNQPDDVVNFSAEYFKCLQEGLILSYPNRGQNIPCDFQTSIPKVHEQRIFMKRIEIEDLDTSLQEEKKEEQKTSGRYNNLTFNKSTFKSNLLEKIQKLTTHKITELQIDDLLDPVVLDTFFNKELFPEFLNFQEEEESHLMRFYEFFKRDTLVNFTQGLVGKEIPCLSINTVYDKFNNEYCNTMHNDYHTRYAKMTSFLLSIFLKKDPGINEDIIIFLEKLRKEIGQDQVTELKYHIIFPVVKNLIDLIIINKNYPAVFRKIQSYHEKITTFLKNSPVVIFLLRDTVIQLADAIVANIINNPKLDENYKKMGVLSIFHLANAFQILDLHFYFIELLLVNKFEYNLVEDFNCLIKQVFDYSLSNEKLCSKPKDEVFTCGEQGVAMSNGSDSTYATDGSYIYAHQKNIGLLKLGTGRGNTVKGKVYVRNRTFMPASPGSLVYACGRLFFRSPDTKPDPFVEVDPDNLVQRKILFNEGQSKFHFAELEASEVNLPYALDRHDLITSTRSSVRSKIVSEGRFIYLISIIGKLKVLDKNVEGKYPDNTLFNLDIFDPLRNCDYVCSLPLTDSLGILSHHPSPFATEAIADDVITDGILLVFLNASNIVTFNLVTREFTGIEDYKKQERYIIDTYNSLMIGIRNADDNKIEIGSKQLEEVNISQYDIKARYNQLNIFIPVKITDCENFPQKESECAIAERHEVGLYEFFISGKPRNFMKKKTNADVEIKSEKWKTVSTLLTILSQGSLRKLWFSQLNSSNMLPHVFQPHVLHFSKKCIGKMATVYKLIMEKFKYKATIESQMFIISSFFTLVNGLLHQLVLLKFTRYRNFNAECGFLKQCVEDAITFSSANSEKISGLTVDLLCQSIQMVDKFSSLFGMDNLTVSEMLFESPVVMFSKAPSLNASIAQSICSMLEKILSVNDAQIFDDIETIIHSADPSTDLPVTVEWEKKYEILISHFLKVIFLGFHAIENKNDTKAIENFQSLFSNFYPIFQLIFTHMENLMQNIDIAIQWVMQSVKKNENVQKILDKIHEMVYVNSYTFRMFYSIISVISLLSSSTYVIFKTWHHFFDFFLLLDRSMKINEKFYTSLNLNLLSKDSIDVFDLVIETSHPSNRNVSKSRKFNFPKPCDVYIEFDPFALKESDELEITYTDEQGNHTESFAKGYRDIVFTQVKDIDIRFNFKSASAFGTKVHIHNHKRYTHLFDCLGKVANSFIINAIKSLFFFNENINNNNTTENANDLEDLLATTIFARGIETLGQELKDCESTSHEYTNFISKLKVNVSDGDDFQEKEPSLFEFDSILKKQLKPIEKFIEYSEIILKQRCPWIIAGGEKAENIVRCAFAVVIKHEKLFNYFIEVGSKICKLEETKGSHLTLSELMSIEGFESLLFVWTEVNKIRQWYMDEMKSLSDENFTLVMNEIMAKCQFLFQLKIPKGSKKLENSSKVDHLEIFGGYQLNQIGIENNLVTKNVIKFMKISGKNNKLNTNGNIPLSEEKKTIHTVLKFIKLTNLSLDSIKKTIYHLNIRAKFRTIAMGLINSILTEAKNVEIKLIIVKQILQSLRMTSARRLVPVDADIKKACPLILRNLSEQFHEFIRHIFHCLMTSSSSFYIASFFDCLLWNFTPRDLRVLLDIGVFENLFIRSPNESLFQAWKMLAKIPDHRSNYTRNYNSELIGQCLLEMFDILSTAVVGKMLTKEDTTSTSTNTNTNSNPIQVRTLKKKSSLTFDNNSVEKIIWQIFCIISNRLEHYLTLYENFLDNINNYEEKFLPQDNFKENFTKDYFDESFLTTFLLFLHKFTLNQSSVVLRYLSNPELLATLLILLRYSTIKNAFLITSILQSTIISLSDSDVDTLSDCLQNKSLFTLLGAKFTSRGETSSRKVIALFLLESLYLLRKGIHEKTAITLGYEYEQAAYIVDLIRFMYSETEWKEALNSIFIDFLTKGSLDTISTVLSILNGDFQELHYGSKVFIKPQVDISKTINEKYTNRADDSIHYTCGYVVGFSQKETNLSDLKKKTELKAFILDELHATRREEDKYVMILKIEKDTYTKAKIKDNDLDFRSVEIKNIILTEEIQIQVCNKHVIDLLVNKFNEMITFSGSLYEYFVTLQLCKVISSLLRENYSGICKTEKLEIISRIPMKCLYQHLSQLEDSAFTCKSYNMHQFTNLLKFYSDRKKSLTFTLQDPLELQKAPAYAKCTLLKPINSILILQKSALTGKTLSIHSSNLVIESEKIKMLHKLKILRYPFSDTSTSLECLKNCMLLCDMENASLLDKIPGMTQSQGIVLLLAQKDSQAAQKSASHLPYIVVNSDYPALDKILTNLEHEKGPVDISQTLEKRTLNRITQIRIEHKPISEEIEYQLCKNEEYTAGIYQLLANLSKKTQTVTKDMMQNYTKKLISYYLRRVCLSIVKENPKMIIDAGDYQFISKQFKIAFFDYCQESHLTVFNHKEIGYLLEVLSKLLDMEKVFKPDDRIIQLDLNENIFSSLNIALSELDISRNSQIDLIDLFIENQLQQTQTLTTKIYLDIVIQLEYFAVFTINSDLYIFFHFLKKLHDLVTRLFHSFSKDTRETDLDQVISTMKKNGLDKLFKYINKSIEKEDAEFSIRTKKLINFLFEFTREYYELHRRLFNFSEMFTIDDLNCNRLSRIIFAINLLYMKATFPELRYQAMINIPAFRAKLTSQCIIPVFNDIFEYSLDFINAKKVELISKSQISHGRALLSAQINADKKYSIIGIVDESSSCGLTVYPRDKLLVAKSETLNYQLWLGGTSLDFEQPEKIKKVISHPTGIVVLTSDGKVYVKGDHNSFGNTPDPAFPNLSKDNKWNEIAQKEGLIDFTANSGGMLMVTSRAVWVTGTNTSSLFSSQFDDYAKITGIKRWDVPFNCSKVADISLGYSHSIFRLEDSSLYGCGSNEYTQLILPSASSIKSLQRLPVEGMRCMKVACGNEASLFIMEDKDGSHRVYSAGYNGYGQIGQGNSSDNKLKKCLGVENIEFRSVCISGNCSCAISNDGKLYTWGCGSSYNLAHPTTEDKYQPTLSEFYSDKLVLDAIITSAYLAVRTVERDGAVKIWMSGDNTNGLISMNVNENASRYYITPIEVTQNFKNSTILTMFGQGSPDFLSFVSANMEPLLKKFDYTCSSCNKIHYRFAILNHRTKLCLSCFKLKDKIKIAFGLKGVGINTVEHVGLALPDLKDLNLHVKKIHRLRCNGCNIIISGVVFMPTDTLGIGTRLLCFCEGCYLSSSYFDIPKLVVIVKGKIELSRFPQMTNSIQLLGFNYSDPLVFSKYIYPNEDGKRILFSEQTEEMKKFVKIYSDIRQEHMFEYNKVTENEGEKTYEELIKYHHLSKMSKEQMEIIKDTVTKLGYAVNEVMPFIFMDEDNAVKDIYISNLPFLNKKTRIELLEKILYEDNGNVDPSGCCLTLSRGKCAKFKQNVQVDVKGNYTIFGQAFQQLKKAQVSQFKAKPNNRLFQAQLVGEGATDAGGPYREMMNLICEELQSPYLDLFIPTPNNRTSSGQDREKWTINPSAQNSLHLEMFTLLGRLFAFAARSLGYMNLNIPSFIWKQILEQALDIYDLEKIDIHTAHFINDLNELEAKGIDTRQFEYIYDLHFTIFLSNGAEAEVKPGGKEIKVTWDNRKEYARLALETRFNECRTQIDAIKNGF